MSSFVVRRCPVAEYFGRHGASDVCVGTWCNLDYGLGELWGGRLERDGTLATGAAQCDFRFVLPSGDYVMASEVGASGQHYTCARRSRSALAMTDTELRLMAAAAMTGESRMPKKG